MNTRTIRTATLAAALVGTLAGGGAIAWAASAPSGTHIEGAGVTASSASADLLRFSREEERLARDLYAALAAAHDGARPMSMITRSEQQHYSAVGALLATYHVPDPSNGLDLKPPTYRANFQDRYMYNPTFESVYAMVPSVPTPGNHEYQTAGAAGYYAYFGAAAGDPAKGYYSFDLGAWHLVSLNSNCSAAGGCSRGSPQETWLRADLAAHPAACTLAYWHHPEYSSGEHGSNTRMAAIWKALEDAGAELVLVGHDHDYERFAPMTSTGTVDEAAGVREFVVGTGGKNHYAVGPVVPGSEVANDDTYGILELALRPDGYSWAFLPEPGKTFTDSGSARCH